MTISSWFNAEKAEDFGKRLADQFASSSVNAGAASSEQRAPTLEAESIQAMLQMAGAEASVLNLNFFRKAKFANSFKWRLIEKGIDKDTADRITQVLLVRLSVTVPSKPEPMQPTVDRPHPGDIKELLNKANKATSQKRFAEAATLYQDLVNFNPTHAVGFNNLGSVLIELGRYREAEEQFRHAIEIEPSYPDPHSNLGTLLRWRGEITASEMSLRRALKIKPNFVEARASLGATLLLLGRLRDAKARFEKVLKSARTNGDALVGMGQIAKMEGRFEEAELFFNKAFTANPKMTSAWAALASIRKMTTEDHAWLTKAEQLAEEVGNPRQAADIGFAIGKYYDDVNEFESAFISFKRANEFLKPIADHYDRSERKSFVNDLIQAYSASSIAAATVGSSSSRKPIFVVGMMRSGTSLAEQIVATHPKVSGGGELEYWTDAVRANSGVLRHAPPGSHLRSLLEKSYLEVLETHSLAATHVVDKTPVNSDFLGIIHSVFPKAKIIYLQRDPIDTCLSCYFQQFSPALNFSMDMSDLAHYYREHHRLMNHWRAVLPAGTVLDVPYAELVKDQEGWSRKMLDFLELNWDPEVLNFNLTKRPVITASSWQVRQKIYKNSVERWRNYEKFIKPLMELRNLSSRPI